MMDKLRTIGTALVIQNNRSTAAPIFIVQQKVRDYGYDDEYTDEFEWLKYGDDIGAVNNPRLVARLDRIWEDGDQDCLLGKYCRVGYKDRWEFVTACFTEQGCKDYLAQDRHNLNKEVRIYAEGSYRNVEFRAVRDFLMKIGTECEVHSIGTKQQLEQTILAQTAEIEDLKAQVERAYENGKGDGYAEGMGAV